MNPVTTTRQMPRETEEDAYRHGYSDGYVSAITNMTERPRQLTMMHLLEQMLWFWETDLCRWQSGECSKKAAPPQFTPEDTL